IAPFLSAATVDGSALFLERPEIFLVVFCLRQSAKLGEQRRVGGVLAIAERTMRRTEGRAKAERGCGSDPARDLERAIELLSGRGHVLNEPETVGLIGSPLIAGQHVAHGVAPTCLADESDRRTAGGEMTAGDFSLAEYGIAGSNPDIGREEKLVA